DVTDTPTDPNYNSFFKYIQKMKDVGITSGCSATTYCPNDPVTRGQMAVFIVRGSYDQQLPASTPVMASVLPTTGTVGKTVMATLTGTNTHFAQGSTTVTVGTGTNITVQNVTVSSSTSLTAQFELAANATAGPQSVVVVTGTEEAVLPNGFS